MDFSVGSPFAFDQAHASLRRITAVADLLAAVDIEKLDSETLEEVADILTSEAQQANHAFQELRTSTAQNQTRQRKAEKLRSDP